MNKGFVLWLTGLPCSGKTTLAIALEDRLKKFYHLRNIQRLDGDIVRKGLNTDLGFSKADRDENIRRVGYLAEMLSDNGINVIASFISPYRDVRDKWRDKIEKFIEVHVDCSKEECKKRDVKGMWAKAARGEIKDFTGYDAPYEKPLRPHTIIKTDEYNLIECVDHLIMYLTEEEYI